MNLTYLFKLWIFEIDFTSIISFLIGIFLGAIIVCGVYAFAVLSSLRNKKFLIKTEVDDITTEEVKQLIIDTQIEYKKKDVRGEKSRITHCTDLCKNLAINIASRFYPNSKHPLLELSVDELMMLIIYIEGRLEEIFNRRGLRLIKRVNVATIFNVTNKTNQVMDSKAFQVTKEVSGAVGTIKKVVNVVNPAWWVRKVVIDNTINFITDKLCLVTIAIIGEETYKIYSKTVFNQDIEIDSNVDQLLNQIDKKLLEASDDVKDNQDIEELPIKTKTNSKKMLNRNYIRKNDCDLVERNLKSDCKKKERKNEKSNTFKKYNEKFCKEDGLNG